MDGIEANPANEAVTALDDVETTTEDGPGMQIHVLQNDLVPDLVKTLTLASAPTHGTATLVQPAMDIRRPGISSTSPMRPISSTWQRARRDRHLHATR